MAEPRDFLVELGTEELPPRALAGLEEAFRDGVVEGLDELEIAHGSAHAYATPRRLAVLVEAVAPEQPSREVTRRGPSEQAAFDADGNPTRAAEGFARSCGVPVDRLTVMETLKGRWLSYRYTEPGRASAELLPGVVSRALEGLPIPKRMRWGDRDVEFVRPVHWLVVLLGERILDCEILGQGADRISHGHRFHHPDAVRIERPGTYVEALRSAYVIADRAERQATIETQVRDAARALEAEPRFDPGLLEEVAGLVEWPVAVTARFEGRFLELPPEVLVSTLESHQRYFPLQRAGRLLPAFVAVANIESRDPEEVRRGNERVVRPRLADAEFFWNEDRRHSLDERAAGLAEVVFEERLGSLADKSRRVAELVRTLAPQVGADEGVAVRAAELAKADLLSEMVGEFPELQGVMGGYYARAQGEPEAVAAAIQEHYLPAHAADELPASPAGRAVAVADRLDTLAGIFAIGMRPSGDKDPFALRRAALGVQRILIERGIDLDLPLLLDSAVRAQPVEPEGNTAGELYEFMMDRLRVYYLSRGTRHDVFDAVLARAPASPVDFDQRLRAVEGFLELPECESLAAANKRIRNILRRAGEEVASAPEPEALVEPAEKGLLEAFTEIRDGVRGRLAERDYGEALATLAALRDPVDRFFDEVLVMSDDDALRRNRLALLGAVQHEFLEIADISRLQTG